MSKAPADLSSYVSKDGTHGLNIDTRYPMSNLDNSDARMQVRSDADDQLILHFAFTEKVKLTGFAIQAPTDEFMPKHIKLFTNQVSVDFNDVENIPAAIEMDLEASDLDGEKMFPLRVVKFNGIHSITLFVESSEGGDVAAVSAVKFFGETLQGTNMSDLKKLPDGQ